MMLGKCLLHTIILIVIPLLSQALEIRSDDIKSNDIHPDFAGLKAGEVAIATKLLETYRDAIKVQKEFQSAFDKQQDLMAQMSTGQKSSNKSRFMQVKQPADPQQIWRGLYDTQPMRTPPQMTVHVFDGEDTTRISEEASTLAVQAEEAAMQNSLHDTLKAFESQAAYDRMNTEIMNQGQSFAQALKKQAEAQRPPPRRQAITPMGTRDGPKPPPAPEVPMRHPPVEEAVAPLASAGKTPCAKTTTFIPVFRQKDVQSNSQFFPMTSPPEGTSDVDTLQVVSPFVHTAVRQEGKPIPIDEVPAGYYGESRVTL